MSFACALLRRRLRRERDGRTFHSGKENDTARTWIAISLVALFGLFAAFAITMASYAINEHCTDQMAMLLGSGAGHCQDSAENALGDPAPQAVRDPSLANSPHFPAPLGTSGIAATGPVMS